MQTSLGEARTLVTSVFQQVAVKATRVFNKSPEEPLTEGPSTEQSSTEQSSTEPPSTEPPSTEQPSTEQPSTEGLPKAFVSWQQLHPEVFEYQPPREIVKKPLRCYFDNLPDYLLLAVFQRYLYDDEEDDFQFHRSYREPTLAANLSFLASPLTLSLVCQRWRKFRDTPSLWTSLAVYKPRSKQIPVITSWLLRSAPQESSEKTKKTSLISLYLHAPPDAGQDQQAIKTILSLFMVPSNTKRMKHLTIKLAGDFPISIPTFDAPHLRSVELDLEGVSDPAPIWRSICQREPRIQKVSWRPTVIKQAMIPYLMPWELLTHLKLPLFAWDVPPTYVLPGLKVALLYCENLVSLEIAIISPAEIPPSTNTYSDEQKADAMRHLGAVREKGSTIYENYTDMEDENIKILISGPVELPRLRHLKIEAQQGETIPFLTDISAPNLRSLEVIHCPKDSSSCSTDGIISFLQRSQPPLESLSLFDSQMRKAEILKLLSHPLPELRHLELYVRPVGNSIMTALTIAEEKHVLPNLRKLVLPECFVSNEHMVKMVESRIRDSTFKELRISLPPVTKKRGIRTMSKEQYHELSLLKDLASNFREEQFKLIVD